MFLWGFVISAIMQIVGIIPADNISVVVDAYSILLALALLVLTIAMYITSGHVENRIYMLFHVSLYWEKLSDEQREFISKKVNKPISKYSFFIVLAFLSGFILSMISLGGYISMEVFKDLILSDWWSLISALLGVIMGGLVAWLVSKHYYIKTVKDIQIQNEASKLVINTMASFLEKHLSEGKTFFHRDNENNIIGLEHHCSDSIMINMLVSTKNEDVEN